MASQSDALSFSTKYLQSSGKRIILQNANGPCPLLAIWNALILRGELKLPSGAVDSSVLQHALVGKIMDTHGDSQDKNLQLQIAETIDLVMEGRFVGGLDVNPQFGSVSGFEYTCEMNVFDLCNVRLLHGWIADPAGGAAIARLAQMSYNSATEVVCSSLADDHMVQSLRSSLSESFRRQIGSLSFGSNGHTPVNIAESVSSPDVKQETSSASVASSPSSDQEAAKHEVLPRHNSAPDHSEVCEVMEEMLERVSRVSLSELDPLSRQAPDASVSPAAPAGDTPQPSGASSLNQAELMAIAQFIQDSQSQLTVTGLFQLTEGMRTGELAVLFRNNHFSTLYKHSDGCLYCLVTDEGYQNEEGVAWEKLDNEKGDTCYVSSSFESYSVHKRRQQEEQEEVIRQIRLSEQGSGQGTAGAAAGGMNHADAGWYAVPDMNRQPHSMRSPPAAAMPAAHASEDADYALALRLHQQEQAALDEQQVAFEAQQRQAAAAQEQLRQAEVAAHRVSVRPLNPAVEQADYCGYGSGSARGQFTGSRRSGPVYTETAKKSSQTDACSIM